MLHINQTLYRLWRHVIIFQLGMWSIDLHDSRWFVSLHKQVPVWSKYRYKNLRNVFKIIFIETSFAERLWFQSSQIYNDKIHMIACLFF